MTSALVVVAQVVGLPALAHKFGTTPLADVKSKASAATRCSGLTGNELAAMMLAPTWPETGAGSNNTPSPMTLSRGDIDADLYSFANPNGDSRRAFWHPGVGVWQIDDAGLALDSMRSANARINTFTAAGYVAAEMASRYCGASGSDAQRRATAFQPWFGCGAGGSTCESLYSQHYCAGTDTVCNITQDSGVGRAGGMSTRTCRYNFDPNTTFLCYYINPSLAQGYTASWVGPPTAGNWPNPPSPLAHPFYAYYRQLTNKEYRHWIYADTGYYYGELYARRPDNQNSRNGLEWVDSDVLCDVSYNRGSC